MPTEQLSSVVVIAQLLGCLARLLTSSQEANDRVVTVGLVLGLVLNLVFGHPDMDVLGVDAQAKEGIGNNVSLRSTPTPNQHPPQVDHPMDMGTRGTDEDKRE